MKQLNGILYIEQKRGWKYKIKFKKKRPFVGVGVELYLHRYSYSYFQISAPLLTQGSIWRNGNNHQLSSVNCESCNVYLSDTDTWHCRHRHRLPLDILIDFFIAKLYYS